MGQPHCRPRSVSLREIRQLRTWPLKLEMVPNLENKEGRILLALKACKDSEKPNIRELVRIYNIPNTTLQR